MESQSITKLTTPTGKPLSSSIGEVVYKEYKGKWQHTYILQRPFSFGHPVRTRDGKLNGSIHAAKGSVWNDRYRDKDGTADAGRHAYAIKINPDGSLKKPYRTYQVGRGGIVRKYYPLYNVPEGSVLKDAGEKPLPGTRVSGWGMYYIGTKNGLLQFKLYELNTRGQEMKPVTFEHDLSKSDVVVVRGVKFKISELKGNGLLNYSIVE